MTTFLAYIAAFVTVLGIFTYLCTPKSWRKGAATLVFVVLSAGTFALAFESAGQPKPVAIEWRSMSNLPVIGFAKDENAEVIYFWVMRDGSPVTYAYPWSGEQAEEAEDLWRARGQLQGMFLNGDEEALVLAEEPDLPPKE